MVSCVASGPALADQGHAHKDQGKQGNGHGNEGASHATSPAGAPGKARNVSRTINVRMLDSMRFEPSSFKVKSGETVKFVVSNAGQLPHEFGIGTAEEQKAHAEMMLADPEMKHEDGSVITVQPGKAGTLIWRFGKAGEYEVGCQVPGHYPAGMKATIAVTTR
jgi:uncharacterized cupredoxin-like copper-binding protein